MTDMISDVVSEIETAIREIDEGGLSDETRERVREKSHLIRGTAIPYDTAAILRQNVADLEKELQRQRDRADKAELRNRILENGQQRLREENESQRFDILAMNQSLYLLREENSQLRKNAEIDVDWLSNVIRIADGSHSLGAGALTEKIIEAIDAARGEK